jgi:hypothetical protein
MKSTLRLAAIVALLGFLGGCAQLGIPAPSGVSTPDTGMYESSLSD